MEYKVRILYMGIYTRKICEALAISDKIIVLGYIVDRSADVDEQKKTHEFWHKYGVMEYQMDDVPKIQPDIVFVCSFWKIIKSELLEKYRFINIHAGILPYWRGANPNSWAIISGENKLGYSIHRVTDVLDGGPIYRIYEQEILLTEKYGDVREKLLNMVADDIEDLFAAIVLDNLMPTSQEGEKYIYCNKMKKSDGIIFDWDELTSIIYGKYRVFGQPYGSGLFFCYKDRKYEILEMRTDPLIGQYYGVPGGVVYKKENETWIKTKDTLVIIGDLKDEDGVIINSTKLFSIGNRI